MNLRPSDGLLNIQLEAMRFVSATARTRNPLPSASPGQTWAEHLNYLPTDSVVSLGLSVELTVSVIGPERGFSQGGYNAVFTIAR